MWLVGFGGEGVCVSGLRKFGVREREWEGKLEGGGVWVREIK